ncbi:MAG TPA: hypothetical protein VNX28_03660 [Gemmataceae bacterium]|jgi:hypothetical protein|nr:hypothetical protein [Gemmataceae bacterium]
MAVKTTCPITHRQFKEHAKPIEVVINHGAPLHAAVKEFSTGSLGWYLNGKTTITIDGKPVSVQIGLNLTIAGSKDVAKEPAPAAPHAPMAAGEPQA